MKKIFLLVGLILVFTSCSDKKELFVPFINEVNFNDLTLERFSHKEPESFVSGGITFYGFAYSNRSNRSFVSSDAKIAVDSNRYSVYTAFPNLTHIYAVGKADGDKCFLKLNSPKVLEYILIAPTTENYLGMFYGPDTGTAIANPNVPSAPKAIWQSYIDGLQRKMNVTGDYAKMVMVGYNGSNKTGEVEYYLCTRLADPNNPKWKILRNDWVRADLNKLGEIDKIVFHFQSFFKGNGTTEVDLVNILPPYFCIDGIKYK